MSDDTPRALLRRLGALDLGEYELAAYLAVLEAGELTAPELARAADIPKTRVYDVARALDDKGFVEVHESRPMRVVAAKPDEAFEELRDSLDALVDELDTRYVEPDPGSEAVSLVTSSRSVRRHLDDVIESAEYELALSIPPSLLEQVASTLRSRYEAGVHVSLLVSPRREAPSATEFPYEEVASLSRTRRGVTTPIVAVADGERAVYATRAAVDGAGEAYGVIFDRSPLGFLVYGFYMTMLWATGEAVIPEEMPRSFPQRYASLRRCVDDLQRLSGPFQATVTGRDVLDGSERTIEGRVVDTTMNVPEGIASLTIETDDGSVTVGGRAAAIEDVEAHRLVVDRA